LLIFSVVALSMVASLDGLFPFWCTSHWQNKCCCCC